MENLQQYQPLSHALNPPVARSPHYSYDTSGQEYNTHGTRREEEEEEEEEVVEEELDEHGRPQGQGGSAQQPPENRTTTGPAASTSQSSEHANAGTASQSQPQPGQPDPDSPLNKRRPGRPKGSRNRKPREGPAPKSQHGFHNYPPPPSTAPHLPGLTPQNQQYYEFQWRILNLCSEFYGAAEELVKATPSVVIAQSYQMGPSSKVDPLNMLAEAKRICDQLLQNPSQLVGQPPPAVYPAVTYTQPASTPASSTPAGSSTPAPSVITNPQSFVMPLNMSGGPHTAPMPGMPYATMYAPPSRYPTAPYYQYPGYYPMHAQSSSAPASAPATYGSANTGATTSTINMNATNVPSASGSWTEEEIERLKKIAEQSRTSSTTSEVDWDWVVSQWGNTRTRHQILLKATSLGLKESTTRGTKRRREADPGNPNEGNSPRTAAPSAPNPTASSAPAPVDASPAESHTTVSTSSAQPSPAAPPTSMKPVSPNLATATTGTTSAPTNRQITNTAAISAPPSNMPWPMPTVASTTSPVITSSQTERPRNDYYRQSAPSKPPSTQGQVGPSPKHGFMYQPNGNARDGRH